MPSAWTQETLLERKRGRAFLRGVPLVSQETDLGAEVRVPLVKRQLHKPQGLGSVTQNSCKELGVAWISVWRRDVKLGGTQRLTSQAV